MSKWWRSAAGILKSAAELRSTRPYHTIQAIPREISGPRISARDRAQGRIPTVVFSQNYVQTNPNDSTAITASASVSRKLLLTTERKQIKTILKHIKLPFFCSTTFPLQIRAGSGSSTILETKRVLPIKIHVDGDGNVLNLVFVWAEDGTELKVDLPIVYTGEDVCPGLKKGTEPKQRRAISYNVSQVLLKEAEAFSGGNSRGSLSRIRSSLKYLCPADQIPSKIEVDLSNLDIGDKVLMHDVVVHPSLKLLSKNEIMPICKIMETYIENMESA